jgi:hypothetical protein
MHKETPFQYKVKLECSCTTCNSNYKLIFFEEETSSETKYCPFCGEEVDSYENNSLKEETERLYTDDEGARFENDIMDDDDY